MEISKWPQNKDHKHSTISDNLNYIIIKTPKEQLILVIQINYVFCAALVLYPYIHPYIHTYSFTIAIHRIWDKDNKSCTNVEALTNGIHMQISRSTNKKEAINFDSNFNRVGLGSNGN